MLALSARLSLEARLQPLVSPQLILQSQLLELNAVALSERIEQELHDNPALEWSDDSVWLPPLMSTASSASDEADPMAALERLRAPQSLTEDLRLQLAHAPVPLRAICSYLIDCLDERGFLDADLAEIAAVLGVPVSRVEEALQLLQNLEPAGIGARNLLECFLLQLQRLPAQDVPPRTAEFLRCFLENPSRKTPGQVAQALGLSAQELSRIVQFVSQRLHLWPAEAYSAPGTLAHSSLPGEQAIVPEAIIEWEGEQLRVRMIQSWGRCLRISEAWGRLDRQLREEGGPLSATAVHIAENIRRARNFIDCLNRREAMLKRITEAIVACQRDFFLHGRQALAPLARKEIARLLHVHESTVSRATAGKFVQLPNYQVVPYDFFFDASQAAKSVLQSFIAHEPPEAPLSDAALAKRLREAGFPIARRTVGKYREQLGIPGAHRRRKACG